MKNFIAHTDQTREEILKSISCASIEDLFKQIPVKFKDFAIGNPLSEMDVQKYIKALARNNKTDYACFAGGGVYNKFIPACVNYVAQRFEFLTAYTPYQPEVSQGTLQIIYEYQTMISRLTGMDIANASMYDAGSACAEAVLMAHRIARGKKNKVLISNNLNPQYKEVVKTYCWAQNIPVEWFNELPQSCNDYCCVLIQNPDYYGEIQEIKKPDTLLIVCTDLASLTLSLTEASTFLADSFSDLVTLSLGATDFPSVSAEVSFFLIGEGRPDRPRRCTLPTIEFLETPSFLPISAVVKPCFHISLS